MKEAYIVEWPIDRTGGIPPRAPTPEERAHEDKNRAVKVSKGLKHLMAHSEKRNKREENGG
jgi:hypothetical protein